MFPKISNGVSFQQDRSGSIVHSIHGSIGGIIVIQYDSQVEICDSSQHSSSCEIIFESGTFSYIFKVLMR